LPYKLLKRTGEHNSLEELVRLNTTPGLRNRESYDDHGEETLELMESLGQETFMDGLEAFPDLLDNCDLKAFRTELKEAGISESGFALFTRAGVEAVINDGYKVKEEKLIGNKLVMTVPSKRYAENYAWLFNPDMPQPLGDMEEPQETDIIPRSLAVVNEDFGIACGLSKRLVDDDQTGEFGAYLARIGRNHAVQEEIYFAGYLTGAAFSHSGVSVPAPSYSDPDGTTGVYVTSGNRQNALSSPGALNITNIQLLMNYMEGIEDPNGKLIMPEMDTLITGTYYRWEAAQIINSAWYPAPAGTTAGAFMAQNQLGPQSSVMTAPLKPVVELHYGQQNNSGNDAKRWYIMASKSRSLCKQLRQPLEVLMESQTAGWSLRQRAQYQRTYIRYAFAWFDARYVGQGSDGTA